MTGKMVARWKAEMFGGGLLAGIGGFFLSLRGGSRRPMKRVFPVRALFQPRLASSS